MACGPPAVGRPADRVSYAVFVATLGLVALATAAELAMLALSHPDRQRMPPLTAVLAGLLVIVFAGAALGHRREVFEALHARPELRLGPVLCAALLVSVVSPLPDELSWASCAILMALAPLGSVRRGLMYCLVVLLANLTACVAAGDLARPATAALLELWTGLPLWTAIATIVPSELTGRLARPAQPPNDAPEPIAPTPAAGDPPTPPARVNPPPPARPPLTARQLQVVSLVAAGHRYQAIAAELSISAGQVHRHVANAIGRLEVQNVNELVAVALATQPFDDARQGRSALPAAAPEHPRVLRPAPGDTPSVGVLDQGRRTASPSVQTPRRQTPARAPDNARTTAVRPLTATPSNESPPDVQPAITSPG
jgi:DNA-binding CsgD family transcriptional regulator